MEKLRLVQLYNTRSGRRIALVSEPTLILVDAYSSVYDLAREAIEKDIPLNEFIAAHLSDEKLDYDPIYKQESEWQLLPSFDHPENPFGCLISGTGLTHKNSALNRQMMHQGGEGKPTDSMQMYQWGVENGSPGKDRIGAQPEWFYKGSGHILRGHGQPLEIPTYGDDGGEEPEIAGVYMIDKGGHPWRIGFTVGNEFSDHIMEKKNYLYLAPSKLRNCAIGPELVIDPDFEDIDGKVRIIRNGQAIWDKPIRTGQKNMAHSLENLEHHHFKYPAHRIPFQAHVHFFGADAFSFGDKIALQTGDVMEIEWTGFGRALQNPLNISQEKEELINVIPMTGDKSTK
jgi:hypothetical protein